MSWFKNWPQGRIARSLVLLAYGLAIGVQRVIPEVGSFELGLGFLVVAVAAGLWKRPRAVPGWAALIFSGLIFTLSLLSDAPLVSQIGVGALVFLIYALGLLQRDRPICQYLFLCRFPILIGLLFVVAPWLATGFAAPVLGNLFVLSTAGLLIVSALAVLASWVLMLTSRLILSHAHKCQGVQPWDFQLPGWAVWKGSQPKPPERVLWLFAILALPLVGVSVVESMQPELAFYLQLAAVVLGVLLARSIFFLGSLLSEHLTDPTGRSSRPRGHHAVKVAEWLRNEDQLPSHRLVAGFFLATFLLYVGGYFFLHPDGPFHWPGFIYLACMVVLIGALLKWWPIWLAAGTGLGLYLAGWYFVSGNGGWVLEVPALAYVLLLIILVGWLLSLVSFYLDRHRVPALPVLFVLPLLLYFIVDIDHYYKLVEKNGRSPSASATLHAPHTPGMAVRPASTGGVSGEELLATGSSTISAAEGREMLDAMDERLRFWQDKYPGEEPVVVLVAASGGGITASLWTAHVLSTLQKHCPQLIDATALISAVSGGGVGAMYFLDAYERAAGVDTPSEQEALFDSVTKKAATSSLSASAWGLAYPDFWRSFSLRHPWDRMMDRAWAMEKAWERTLGQEDIPTLEDWGNKARSGEMPVLLFNATISETGERFLMPTLDLRSIRCKVSEEGCRDRSRTVGALYDNHSMSVVTAARLSATFPFVSPIARAFESDADNGFHIADGGYYDNFGVVSLLEWFLELLEEGRPIKVVVLEIRAYPKQEDVQTARERAGWLYASAGPLTTMLRVRTSSQIARNDLDLELIKKLGGKEFPVVPILVSLEMENPPISWHLSAGQRKRIEAENLSGALDEVRAALPGICAVDGGVQVARLGHQDSVEDRELAQ